MTRDSLYRPLMRSDIEDRARSEILLPEKEWYRVFVYADIRGEPIMDGGWLVGNIEFGNPNVPDDVVRLAIVNTDHQVQIQTMYDNRLIEYKNQTLTS
jgi:hypothetical protein